MESTHDSMRSAIQWRKWRSLQRDNYPSAAAYIAAYRKQFDNVHRRRQGPSCFVAHWTLMKELEDELPEARCAIGYLNLHQDPEGLNHDTFVAHCDHMITKSNNPDLVFSNDSRGKERDAPCPRPRGSSSKRQRC
ncbi:hypothetical protein N7491_006488 [Penicillium cf. griseofulvum]|uniref:Uncharacterized protein n=1 Tax=Penicillium cf. griseofulvum TaxID=2972120 RepID=A0A9W9IWW0_9EURO|nr:hypothetical protein N7472_010482 [Penicillium cf. griseofulvum]KAJ5429472.1 hypothetical protein N7491_006488 [Penicillium cf. griseofulvum]KAJ5436746.1 hypothetical protein N7445_007631 [Penicillium cf. griseofulvum]